MIRKALTTLSMLVLATLALITFRPSESHVEPVFTPTPSASPTLPACAAEDGAGQALCYWDGATMGNGKGRAIISGDCAPEYVGGETASAECVATHTMPSTKRTNADGSVVTIPNGADLVAECNDINNQIIQGIAKTEEGWSLIECYKAQRDS